MEIPPSAIIEVLTERGLAHDPKTLAKHHAQGLVSLVYTISSPVGELIIHVSKITASIRHFRIWEKLQPISQFLCAIPGVPASEVLFTFTWPEHYLVVQRKLPGKNAGKGVFKDGKLFMDWYVPPASVEKQIEEILANIHHVPLKGFGELALRDGKLEGQHSSWEFFLRTDFPLWLHGITVADDFLGSPKDSFVEDAMAFLDRALPYVKNCTQASLVSCDVLNPSNILVEGTTVTGLIDWEWAIAADPAWEFAYMNRFSLEHYFTRFPSLASEEAQQAFILRSKLYEPMLYVMWAFAISGIPESEFYGITRERAKVGIQQAIALLNER